MHQKTKSGNVFSFVALLAFCLLIAPGLATADPELRLKNSTSSVTLPLARPDWPQPQDTHMVFYLQRTMNRNTIVYASRYDADGNLHPKKPIEVYWRRFEEQNQKRALKFIEHLLAYGVRTRRNREENGWSITFAGLPKTLSAQLRQSGPFQSALWARINNREYKLISGFLDLDDSGFITRVVQLRLYTFDPVSENYVTHLIKVSGGDIHE